jgi:hypothetical protein
MVFRKQRLVSTPTAVAYGVQHNHMLRCVVLCHAVPCSGTAACCGVLCHVVGQQPAVACCVMLCHVVGLPVLPLMPSGTHRLLSGPQVLQRLMPMLRPAILLPMDLCRLLQECYHHMHVYFLQHLCLHKHIMHPQLDAFQPLQMHATPNPPPQR